MKIITKLIAGSLLILAGYHTKAQILTPVQWSYAAKRTGPTEAVVFLKASIGPGWHIYSQYIKDGGPVQTSFKFKQSTAYQLLGKVLEPKPVTRMEEVFGMKVSFFENEAIFQQKIRLKKGRATTVSGSLEYMTCNDQKCLPPESVDFAITIK